MTNGYRNVQSRNGEFSATIRRDVNEALEAYCRTTRINKSVYVNECVRKCLAEDQENLKRDRYMIYTKDQLIDLLMSQEADNGRPKD